MAWDNAIKIAMGGDDNTTPAHKRHKLPPIQE